MYCIITTFPYHVATAQLKTAVLITFVVHVYACKITLYMYMYMALQHNILLMYMCDKTLCSIFGLCRHTCKCTCRHNPWSGYPSPGYHASLWTCLHTGWCVSFWLVTHNMATSCCIQIKGTRTTSWQTGPAV